MKRPYDFTGKTVAGWIVDELLSHDRNGTYRWKCRCADCGREAILTTFQLNRLAQDWDGRPAHPNCPGREKKDSPAPPPKRRDPRELCRSGCKWWMRLSMSDGHACHYCYYTGRRRERDTKGNCLSFTPGHPEHRQADIIFGKITREKGE